VTDAQPTADLLTRVFPHSARPLDEAFVRWQVTLRPIDGRWQIVDVSDAAP